MSREADAVSGIVAVFAAIGLGMGLTGFAGMGWAQSQFLVAAGGETARQFGPVFVALVYFQNANTAFFVGPVVAVLAGVLFGSRLRSGPTAAAVAAGSSLLGFYVMAFLTVLVMALALGGPGGSQAFGLGQAVGPILTAGVPTAVVGGVAGYLGATMD